MCVQASQPGILWNFASEIRWKAEPKRVIVPYAKAFIPNIVHGLEYGGTREILSEATTTMW